MPFDNMNYGGGNNPHNGFGVIVGVRSPDTGREFFYNAIILDRKNGILVTCANNVGSSNKAEVLLPDIRKKFAAKIFKTHWKVNLTYLSVEGKLPVSPDPVLRNRPLKYLDDITVIGYGDDGRWREVPFTIVKNESRYGITLAMIKKEIDTWDKLFIPPTDKSILYDRYIVATTPREAKFPGSGAAVLDNEGNLAGIVSLGVFGTILAVPASELHTSVPVSKVRRYFGPLRGGYSTPVPE